MKLSLLIKQLHRFLEFGIMRADLRLGYHGEMVETRLEDAIDEIKVWCKEKKGREIGDGEIALKLHFPSR